MPEGRELLEVRLWCLVHGGIASLGKDEMEWYVEQTKIVVRLPNWVRGRILRRY
jgi:hypothetical protein